MSVSTSVMYTEQTTEGADILQWPHNTHNTILIKQ